MDAVLYMCLLFFFCGYVRARPSHRNTVLHYAAAYNMLKAHDICMQHLGVNWKCAVLAVNDDGKSPFAVAGGVEMLDRLSELQPAALAALEKVVEDARVSGLLPNPQHALWQLAAIAGLAAAIVKFQILSYTYGLAAVFLVTAIRFSNSQTVGFAMCAFVAPVVTWVYTLFSQWGCMNGACYQLSTYGKFFLAVYNLGRPALVVAKFAHGLLTRTMTLADAKQRHNQWVDDLYMEQVGKIVDIPVATLKQHGLIPKQQIPYRTAAHNLMHAAKEKFYYWVEGK